MIEVEVDGTRIPASTMVDGLCIFYSINIQVPRKLMTRETNKIPIQTSKPTVNLDNALGRKSYVSSHSVNNLVEVRPSETPP
jgi:hypothetical protein